MVEKFSSLQFYSRSDHQPFLLFVNNQGKKKSFLEKVKLSSFIEKIGLYSSDKGKILNNGWQTKIYNLKKHHNIQKI